MQAVLAIVQADSDSVVQGNACCHIRQAFSQQQEYTGRRPHQGGRQEPEQRQQQQTCERPAFASKTVSRSQDKAVRYVGLAVTKGKMQLRSFGCMCCDV